MVAGSTVPVGLFGLHTNTIVGACRLDQVAGGVGIDREVGPTLPHHDLGAGDAGDVRVQRVRGLEHRRAPSGAAVGEQERLQHLVRSVGAEQPVDRLPEVRTQSAPAAPGRRGPGTG